MRRASASGPGAIQHAVGGRRRVDGGRGLGSALLRLRGQHGKRGPQCRRPGSEAGRRRPVEHRVERRVPVGVAWLPMVRLRSCPPGKFSSPAAPSAPGHPTSPAPRRHRETRPPPSGCGHYSEGPPGQPERPWYSRAATLSRPSRNSPVPAAARERPAGIPERTQHKQCTSDGSHATTLMGKSTSPLFRRGPGAFLGLADIPSPEIFLLLPTSPRLRTILSRRTVPGRRPLAHSRPMS